MSVPTCAPPPRFDDYLRVCAAPPPGPRGLFFWLILGLLVALGLLWPSAKWLRFTCDVLLLTALLALVPVLSHALDLSRPPRVLLESVLFMAVIVNFALWMGGRRALGLWLLPVTTFVLVLEIGSNTLEYAMEETANRALRIPSPRVNEAVADIREMFRRGTLLYLSVPLGLLAGVILALTRGHVGAAGLKYCYRITIGLASLFLAYLIGHAFVRMCSSMFSRTAPAKKTGQAEADFAAAMVATAVRKFYLSEALHDIVLFAILAAFELSLWGVPVAGRWGTALVIVAAAIYLLNQLPFAIGQSAMHRAILRDYDEGPRADLQKKLSEFAPLSPTSAFIAAQVASGTAGAFLYALMENFLKEKLKNP